MQEWGNGRKARIRRRHILAAEHLRAEATHLLSKAKSSEELEKMDVGNRMFLVGFHTIQANLWGKSIVEFGDE